MFFSVKSHENRFQCFPAFVGQALTRPHLYFTLIHTFRFCSFLCAAAKYTIQHNKLCFPVFSLFHDTALTLDNNFQMNDSFQQPGRWHDFILTPEHRPVSEPLTHIMSYTIKNLHPGAYYEAIVQAKNRYGWNEVSANKTSWILKKSPACCRYLILFEVVMILLNNNCIYPLKRKSSLNILCILYIRYKKPNLYFRIFYESKQ